MSRPDDLSNVFSQPSPDFGYRQGVVLTWNRTSGENSVRVGNSTLTDLPTLTADGQTIIYPGDVVALLRYKTSWFIMGRISRVNDQRMNLFAAGLMGPGDPQTSLWPGTANTTDTDLWSGWVTHSGKNLVVYNRTSVPTGVTAEFSFWIDGAQVHSSGTYLEGIGNYTFGVDFPEHLAYNTTYLCNLKAKVLSGTGTVKASFQGMYGF